MDRRRWPVVALALVVGAGTAAAQEQDEAAGGPKQEGGDGAGQPGAGAYQGVVPGSGHAPPKAGAARQREARLLTWPGFQMRPDGASRFFVQTSKAVETESNGEKPQRFELVLQDTKVHLRNNRRPLETRHFNTPVRRARIERRGSDVAVVLELRAEVTPFVRSEGGSDGFHYVFVEFPPGDYVEQKPSGGESGAAPAPSGGSVGTVR